MSEGTSRLAGHLGGIHYSDRGRVHLKNIPDPVHILQAYSEHDAPPSNRWVLMFFGKPGRTIGWKLGLAVVLLAAVTAASVAYLTTGDTEGGNAAPTTTGTSTNGVLAAQSPETALAPNAGLDAIVPAALWKDCRLQTVPEPNAAQTAVCVPPKGLPDRWEISSYRSGSDLMSAYRAEFHRHPGSQRQHRKVQRVHLGRRAPVAARTRQAGRARLLLLRRQRRRHRLDPPASRPADAS